MLSRESKYLSPHKCINILHYYYNIYVVSPAMSAWPKYSYIIVRFPNDLGAASSPD